MIAILPEFPATHEKSTGIFIRRMGWGLFLVAVGLAGCSRQEQTGQKAPPVPVAVGRVEHVQTLRTLSVSGTVVSPFAPTHPSFLAAGRVEEVVPREGDYVKKGALLARLDAADYRNAAASARAQAAQARVAAERATSEYDRMAFLFERQSLARNDFEKFKAVADAAALKLDEARAAARIQQKRLTDTVLYAPVSGFVSRRLVEPGQTAAAGAPAFEIVRLDPVEILVGVPEGDIHLVKIGQKARVTLPALPESAFEGTVRVINVSADSRTRTYMTRIVLPNPGHQLRVGMVAEAAISGDQKVDAMTLPTTAIVHDPQGAPLVYVYDPGQQRAYARRVALGALIGAEVEIRDGLSGAEAVVVAGQNKLRDGAAVTVTDASGSAH
jgi:RND family efflux transporter MFP subunit